MIIKSFLLIAIMGGALSAASPEQAVIDAEKSWGDAIFSGDVAKLDKIFAADLTYDHSNGNHDTKESYIAKIRSGEQKYEKFAYDEGMKARVYGNAAVVNATARFDSLSGGKSTPTHLRFVHVYVKKDGRWQMVAHQSTRLTD